MRCVSRDADQPFLRIGVGRGPETSIPTETAGRFPEIGAAHRDSKARAPSSWNHRRTVRHPPSAKAGLSSVVISSTVGRASRLFAAVPPLREHHATEGEMSSAVETARPLPGFEDRRLAPSSVLALRRRRRACSSPHHSRRRQPARFSLSAGTEARILHAERRQRAAPAAPRPTTGSTARASRMPSTCSNPCDTASAHQADGSKAALAQARHVLIGRHCGHEGAWRNACLLHRLLDRVSRQKSITAPMPRRNVSRSRNVIDRAAGAVSSSRLDRALPGHDDRQVPATAPVHRIVEPGGFLPRPSTSPPRRAPALVSEEIRKIVSRRIFSLPLTARGAADRDMRFAMPMNEGNKARHVASLHSRIQQTAQTLEPRFGKAAFHSVFSEFGIDHDLNGIGEERRQAVILRIDGGDGGHADPRLAAEAPACTD